MSGSGGYWQCFFCFQHPTHTYFSQHNYSTCAACPARGGGQWRRPCTFWKPHFMSLPGVWSDDSDDLSIFELFWTLLAFLNFFELLPAAGFSACAAGFLPGVSSDDCTTHFVWLFNFSTRDFIKLIGFIVFSSNLLIFVPPNFNFTSGPIVPGCGC